MAGLIPVVIDRLSGTLVLVSPHHVESVRFDRLGQNSSQAYAFRMASGAIIHLNKIEAEKIFAALDTPPPHQGGE